MAGFIVDNLFYVYQNGKFSYVRRYSQIAWLNMKMISEKF